MWKEICSCLPDMMAHISLLVGDGRMIGVVRDQWVVDIPLSC